MATDPEMEHLEKQLQLSVDSLSTLLEKKERSGGRKEAEKGEEEGGKEEGEDTQGGEESGSEEEDNQSEGDLLERKGAPSLTDQMSLLSPGSQQLTARDLSSESALEDSLNSVSHTDSPAVPPSADGATPEASGPSRSALFSSSGRVPTSTSSSPGAPLSEERASRPRSQSCDSRQRFGGPGPSHREKPLMIPSSTPPWLEMVGLACCVCVCLYEYIHTCMLCVYD